MKSFGISSSWLSSSIVLVVVLSLVIAVESAISLPLSVSQESGTDNVTIRYGIHEQGPSLLLSVHVQSVDDAQGPRAAGLAVILADASSAAPADESVVILTPQQSAMCPSVFRMATLPNGTRFIRPPRAGELYRPHRTFDGIIELHPVPTTWWRATTDVEPVAQFSFHLATFSLDVWRNEAGCYSLEDVAANLTTITQNSVTLIIPSTSTPNRNASEVPSPRSESCSNGVPGKTTLASCIACYDEWVGPSCNVSCSCGGNGGTCIGNVTVAKPICSSCASGFFGPGCEHECRCTHSTGCDDGLNGTGACRCKAGFTGESCDVCASGHFGGECAKCTCLNGTCSEGPRGDGRCLACNPGYAGELCDAKCPASCPAFHACSANVSGTGTCVPSDTDQQASPDTHITSATLTLSGDLANFADLQFRETIGNALLVPTQQVTILSLVSGSVIVTLRLEGDVAALQPKYRLLEVIAAEAITNSSGPLHVAGLLNFTVARVGDVPVATTLPPPVSREPTSPFRMSPKEDDGGRVLLIVGTCLAAVVVFAIGGLLAYYLKSRQKKARSRHSTRDESAKRYGLGMDSPAPDTDVDRHKAAARKNSEAKATRPDAPSKLDVAGESDPDTHVVDVEEATNTSPRPSQQPGRRIGARAARYAFGGSSSDFDTSASQQSPVVSAVRAIYAVKASSDDQVRLHDSYDTVTSSNPQRSTPGTLAISAEDRYRQRLYSGVTPENGDDDVVVGEDALNSSTPLKTPPVSRPVSGTPQKHSKAPQSLVSSISPEIAAATAPNPSHASVVSLGESSEDQSPAPMGKPQYHEHDLSVDSDAAQLAAPVGLPLGPSGAHRASAASVQEANRSVDDANVSSETLGNTPTPSRPSSAAHRRSPSIGSVSRPGSSGRPESSGGRPRSAKKCKFCDKPFSEAPDICEVEQRPHRDLKDERRAEKKAKKEVRRRLQETVATVLESTEDLMEGDHDPHGGGDL